MTEENQKLIYNGYSLEALVEKISQCVYRDELINMQKHTRDNPMNYGNVSFWLQRGENGTTLVYTKHPKNWDLNSIIVELELEDQNYYKSNFGFDFNWDTYNQN